MENKKTLFQLLKNAWKEWRSESKEARRMREYAETISLHSKKTGSFLRATHETDVMQAYFKACKAKEAEVAKNVRAMVFGATDQEKTALKASLMSLGIDLDSIMGEADAEDAYMETGWTSRANRSTEVTELPKGEALADRPLSDFNISAVHAKRLQDAQGIEPKAIGEESAGEAYIKEVMARHTHDPRKSVSGATTNEIPHNSVWPEVIHSGHELSLEETAKSLLTGTIPPFEEMSAIPPEEQAKMKEYVETIRNNAVVPDAKSIDNMPITVSTTEQMPEFELPIPEITGEDNPDPKPIYAVDRPLIPERTGELPLTTAEMIAAVTTDTVSIDQMPEGTTFTPTVAMPKEEKEYIEAAVAVLDDASPEQNVSDVPEPSSSSEEQK